MTTKWIPRAAVVSLGLAASTFAHALEQADVMHRRFTAPITVSDTGQPTIGEISGAQGPLAEAVRSQLAALQYVPARREGAAVDHTTHLSGTAVLTPLPDGSFDMRVQAVLVPTMTASVAPRYPPGQLRRGNSGSVELILRVGADGRIDEVRTVASSHSDFDRAVREAARKWRFASRPGADPVEVAMPVWFQVGTGASSIPGRRPQRLPVGEVPQFQCEMDPGRAHVAGQSGCLDRIEITGYRYRYRY